MEATAAAGTRDETKRSAQINKCFIALSESNTVGILQNAGEITTCTQGSMHRFYSVLNFHRLHNMKVLLEGTWFQRCLSFCILGGGPDVAVSHHALVPTNP